MRRNDIINLIGKKYLKSNIENDEFSYKKEFNRIGKNFQEYVNSDNKTTHTNVDIRFADESLSILVETKNNYDTYNLDDIFKQLQAYVDYEKEISNNKIIAMIANTEDNRILVWYGEDIIINFDNLRRDEQKIKSFEEYSDIYFSKKNDKLKVIQSTYELNELLHEEGIREKIRSQFVGTCLLALKNNLMYENLRTKQIIGGIEEILYNLLDNDSSKANKLNILKTKVLESQDVKDLTNEGFGKILRTIDNEILPFINDKSTVGQDLLNLFFTTFNKYVGKTDKNQAFTPDHIVHFMCKVVGINRNSRVLDPCCGSGAFLVRALTEAMDDCNTNTEKDNVKKHNIYGIEYEEGAFGLSTTNMLIHGDGNSNIMQGSCFEKLDLIKDKDINVVLMNPPYNAQKKHSNPNYSKTWTKSAKTDPSKGFHFVYYVASKIKTGKLAVLLPPACAIGTSNEIKKFKQCMLNEHTLDAVFSLPNDIFHPGSTSAACCMIFNLGTRHNKAPIKETFFGFYKDDGFVKKKNLGRVEKGNWEEIEKKWLDLYFKRESFPGLSVTKQISSKDEWLAEQYMETDYSTLNQNDFQKVLNEYIGYLIANGDLNEEN